LRDLAKFFVHEPKLPNGYLATPKMLVR